MPVPDLDREEQPEAVAVIDAPGHVLADEPPHLLPPKHAVLHESTRLGDLLDEVTQLRPEPQPEREAEPLLLPVQQVVWQVTLAELSRDVLDAPRLHLPLGGQAHRELGHAPVEERVP